MSESFPAMGIMMVSHSRYAVTIQEYRLRPPRSSASLVPMVPTMVPSKHAPSMATQRPIMMVVRTFGSMFLYVICSAAMGTPPRILDRNTLEQDVV